MVSGNGVCEEDELLRGGWFVRQCPSGEMERTGTGKRELSYQFGMRVGQTDRYKASEVLSP